MDTTTNNHCTVDLLRTKENLKDVPQSQLEWLMSEGTCETIKEGDFIFQPEEPVENLRILLKGDLQIYFLQNGSKNTLAESSAPLIT